MIKEKLIEQFGENILCNSALWYVDGEKNLHEILNKIDVKDVIEIGTMYGLTTAILAEYAKGKVYTIDVCDYIKKFQVWQYLGIYNIKSIIVENHFGKKRIIELLQSFKRDINVAFIDGLHWYGQPEEDYYLLREIPYIIFHDYNNIHNEVVDFINGPAVKNKKKEIYGDYVLVYDEEVKNDGLSE